MAMLWNLVFSMIGGLKTIPKDILDAAKFLKSKALKTKIRYNSCYFPIHYYRFALSLGAGLEPLIVAEALHSLFPTEQWKRSFGLRKPTGKLLLPRTKLCILGRFNYHDHFNYRN